MNAREELINYICKMTPEQAKKVLESTEVMEIMKKYRSEKV